MTAMTVLAQWLNVAAIPASRRAAAGLMPVLIGGPLLPIKATDSSDQARPMALTGIMRDLAQDVQDITGAFASEDWPKRPGTRMAPPPLPHSPTSRPTASLLPSTVSQAIAGVLA